MKSNYKQLGNYIREVNVINGEFGEDSLRGISSIYKHFMPSKANTIGVDFKGYKEVEPRQFAYNPNTARMGDKIPIALNDSEDTFIVSKIYPVFEIIDFDQLLPEYLIMWFMRSEFDRYARFKSHGSAREVFSWEEMCDVELPVPDIEKQRSIVNEYHTIVERIEINNQFIQKLEEIAQAIFHHWFIDFEFPNDNGQRYQSSGGGMKWCEELAIDIPKGWGGGVIRDIMKINYGKSLPKDQRIEGDVKVYSSAGNIGQHIEALTKEPSVIIGRKGSIGTVYYEINPSFCIDTAYYVSKSDSKTPLIFVYYLLRYLRLDRLNEDSAVPGLNRNTTYSIPILIPSQKFLEKFAEIANYLYERRTLLLEEQKKLEILSQVLTSNLSNP
jgi:type I restriction enzyme, S subunit